MLFWIKNTFSVAFVFSDSSTINAFVCSFAALKSCIEVSEDEWSPGNLAAPVEVMITSVVVFLLSVSAVVIVLFQCTFTTSLPSPRTQYCLFRCFLKPWCFSFHSMGSCNRFSICVLRSYFILPGSYPNEIVARKRWVPDEWFQCLKQELY